MKIIIAIPALNEETVLRRSVETLLHFLALKLSHHDFMAVIVDNGSDDKTQEIGLALQAEYPGVRYLRLGSRGKGLAIRSGWAHADADIFVFMDADLSTDLEALPDLIAAIENGADVAVGSRFHERSRVSRTIARKTLSAGYRLLLKGVFGTSVTDVPCGFKAVSATVVREMVPKVKDQRWFFDTELVMRCERAGYRIHEIPVVWQDFRPAGTRSKVVVGKLIAEYLGQCLRLWGELRGEEAKRRRGEVSKQEWRWILGITALVMAVTSIPPLYALWQAKASGLEWIGRQFLARSDAAFYFSYIEQAKRGRWLFENQFTTESMTPVLNVFWLAVGALARLFSLSSLAAYHAARLALIPAFAAAAYLFIAATFTDVRRRLWSYMLFMLGSGLGFYYFILFSPTWVGSRYDWPTDLWVAESNAFLSMLYSPHVIASFALIIISFHLLLKAFETGRVRYGAMAGAAALVLFQFHPFHVPVLYAVPGVFLVAAAVRRSLRRDMALSYLLFLAISLPSVIYHLQVLRDPLWQAVSNDNATPTPAISHVFLGFGLISVLWVFGYRILRGERSQAPRLGGEPGSFRTGAFRVEFLLVWVAVQAVLIYSPFLFQRRMLEGLQFPLTLLAIPAIIAAWHWFMAKTGGGRQFMIISGILLAYVLFLPSTVGALFRSIDVYQQNQSPVFYWTPDRSAALDWLHNETPEDAAVLSAADTGNGIVGWAYRRVYAGHWAGTPFFAEKTRHIADFYGVMDTDRVAFLRENGIDYVYWGPAERAFGGQLDTYDFLEKKFEAGEIVIFRATERLSD